MRRSIPSLNWLRVFEAAARTGSFAAAARLLHMSNSAVSQQIKALETHLQAQLFIRAAHSIELTSAGQDFMPLVQQSLSTLEGAADSLFRHRAKRVVNLQVSLIFATSWLIPRLADFYRQHQDILVNISGGYRDNDIDRQGPELYIHYGAANRQWGVAESLLQDQLYPVALAERIASGVPLTAQRLIEIPSHHSGWSELLAHNQLQLDSEAEFVQVDSTDIALCMAASDLGVALARAPISDQLMARYRLDPWPGIEPLPCTESYHLLYRSLPSLSPGAKQFRIWLLKQLAIEA